MLEKFKKIKEKIKERPIQILIAFIITYLFIVCVFAIKYHNLSKKIIDTKDALFQIWTAELTITAITVTIITISLTATNKKLYGIQLSKIIILSDWFELRLVLFFLIDTLTYIPVIWGSFIYTSLCYLISLLLAFWHTGESIRVLSYPEKYEELVKKFYIDKINDSKKDDIYTLIGKNLYPYICELIENGNLNEYNENFKFLIYLFEISNNKFEISNNNHDLELSRFIEDKLYKVLQLTFKNNLKEETIIFISEHIFRSRGLFVPYYKNLILKIFYDIVYNVDEKSFKLFLKRFVSVKDFILLERKDIFLEIIVKLGIYIYSIYLGSKKDEKRKGILKKIVNEAISKHISFSELLNNTIQNNINDFISLKRSLFSDEVCTHCLIEREFYAYFLITYCKSRRDLEERLPNLPNLNIKILERHYQTLLDLFSISLNEAERKEKILDLFMKILLKKDNENRKQEHSNSKDV